jgi:ABC-type dipeptide/oligopeptide/nickel transport system permease subunit
MANTTIVVAPPETALVRIGRTVRTARRLPLVSILLLAVVVVAGITAPWISPHNPTRGTLTDRNMPGFWAGDQTALKIVVAEVAAGEGFKQISLEDARKVRAEAVVGEEVEVVTRRTGGTKYLLGTDHLGRDLLSRTISWPAGMAALSMSSLCGWWTLNWRCP